MEQQCKERQPWSHCYKGRRCFQMTMHGSFPHTWRNLFWWGYGRGAIELNSRNVGGRELVACWRHASMCNSGAYCFQTRSPTTVPGDKQIRHSNTLTTIWENWVTWEFLPYFLPLVKTEKLLNISCSIVQTSSTQQQDITSVDILW